ncbi:hypothetical protein TorRG33x02_038220 [Trema orientale]|uniref:FBD domain containing protein n=1 Tax=Trema orientale TaxID=63057 RepID=A0A2P5FRM6_TREOI|nr:hypothetical protein TorRG33x02_038220 [Trema orientale]
MEEADLDFGVESEFKECGDILQKLLVDLYRVKTLTDYEAPFDERWTRCLPIYPCVHKTLKVVEVNGFKGSHDACLLLVYFVSFGSVMEKLDLKVSKEVGHGESAEVGLRKAQMLQNIKKASPSLQISIF